VLSSCEVFFIKLSNFCVTIIIAVLSLTEFIPYFLQMYNNIPISKLSNKNKLQTTTVYFTIPLDYLTIAMDYIVTATDYLTIALD